MGTWGGPSSKGMRTFVSATPAGKQWWPSRRENAARGGHCLDRASGSSAHLEVAGWGISRCAPLSESPRASSRVKTLNGGALGGAPGKQRIGNLAHARHRTQLAPQTPNLYIVKCPWGDRSPTLASDPYVGRPGAAFFPMLLSITKLDEKLWPCCPPSRLGGNKSSTECRWLGRSRAFLSGEGRRAVRLPGDRECQRRVTT